MLEAAMTTFFVEASENLDLMEQSLLTIEAAGHSNYSEDVNAIFRAVHTIKGSAGMFGFDDVVSFTHVLENLLDELRNLGVELNGALVSLLFASCDHTGKLLDSTSSGEVSDELRQHSRRLIQQIENTCQLLSRNVNGTDVTDTATVANPYWHISLRMPITSFTDGMDPLPFIAYLGTLGKLISVDVVDALLPETKFFDLENCYLGFEISLESDATHEDILSTFEFIDAEQAVIVIEPFSMLSAYQQLLDARPETSQTLQRLGGHYDAIWKELQYLNSNDGEQVLKDNAHITQTNDDKTLSVNTNEAPKNSSLRVDSEKLDGLINLISELVTTAAGVALISQAIPNMNESVSNLNSLVEEIRDAALRLRMVPVAGTFNRFNRVVRDTALALGKEVSLIISGEDTELDKSVIEQIADPLVHLVRNAIDHGIEMPDERLSKGKPANGMLMLSAYHSSGSIVLKISDDGRGLNPQLIRQKAIEKGLISVEQSLSDEDIFQLIFEPGFSTKQVVTDLSGRGVGMDVVRRNITELRGRIEVNSELDKGTTISIFMPLTLAIIDGFLIGVGDERFVLPLDMVEECVALDEAELRAGDKGSYMSLRGEVLPLLDLRNLFDLKGNVSRRRSVIVIVTNNQKYGVIVDRLLGECQTVIKPLGTLFKKLSGVGGSTIMADGQVALILDMDNLTSNIR